MFPKRTARRPPDDNRPVLRLGVSLLVSLLLVAATPLTDASGLLAGLEAQSLDLRFRLRGPVAPGPDVALVMIDEKTVGAYGRWPLPRERLAEAVHRLKADGAKVVGFDLLFLEQGGSERLPAWAETKIRGALARGSEDPAVLEELLRLNPSDGTLSGAVRSAGNVLVPYAFVAEAGQPRDDARPAALPGAAFSVVRMPGGVARPRLPIEPAHVLAPAADLLTAAVSTGHVTVALAGDGNLRHHYPVIRYGEEYFPSLPVEMARLHLRVPKDQAAVLLGSGIDLGGRFLPTDPRMRLLVDYYGPEGTFPTWSLVDVLEGRVPRRSLWGRTVLIGASAAGAGGSFPTPFTATLPGTEYFATVVDNILQGRLLRRDDLAAGIDILGILAGGMLAALAGYLAPVAVSAAVALLLLAAWGMLAYIAFAAGGLWLGAVLPAAAIVLNFGTQEIWGTLIERRRRRAAERQRLNLSRYFAPSIVEAIAERSASVETARSQDAAVLFVDLSGFTGLCERLPPEEAMALLRTFHRMVESAVFAHGGTLDKFIGDGALAVFGVPVPGEADAAEALRCGRRLLDGTSKWNAGSDTPGSRVDASVGIHFGPVLAGDVGGERQFQYTVTGDTVNVASRLQSLCRELGVRAIFSDAVVRAARASAAWDENLLDGMEHAPELRLRGRERPIAAWTGTLR